MRKVSTTASGADKEYIQVRLQQEQAVIDDLFGAKLERLPAFYSQAGELALRLAAASVDLSTQSQSDGDLPAKAELIRAARQRLNSVQLAFNNECASGKSGKVCRLDD